MLNNSESNTNLYFEFEVTKPQIQIVIELQNQFHGWDLKSKSIVRPRTNLPVGAEHHLVNRIDLVTNFNNLPRKIRDMLNLAIGKEYELPIIAAVHYFNVKQVKHLIEAALHSLENNLPFQHSNCFFDEDRVKVLVDEQMKYGIIFEADKKYNDRFLVELDAENGKNLRLFVSKPNLELDIY